MPGWTLQPKLTAAAIVPFDDTPLDERSALAIRWVLERERESGRQAGLITAQMDRFGPPLEAFKRDHPYSSLRSPKPFGSGPVLVHATGMKGLAKALRGGADRAVAYVAWGDDRWLPGWAAAPSTSAPVNLSTHLATNSASCWTTWTSPATTAGTTRRASVTREAFSASSTIWRSATSRSGDARARPFS